MEPNDQPLSGQQLQAALKTFSDQLLKIRQDVELRKFAVAQTTELVRHMPDASNPVKLARELHAFLVEPATVEMS